MNWKQMNPDYLQERVTQARACASLENKIEHLCQGLDHLAYCLRELLASRDRRKDQPPS